VQVQLCS